MSYHAYQQLIHDTAKSLGLDEYPYLLEEHQSGLVTLVFDALEGHEQQTDIVYLGYRRAGNELVISQCLDTLDAGDKQVYRHALQHNDARSVPGTPFAMIAAGEDNETKALTFYLCLPLDEGFDSEALIGHIGRFMEQSNEFIKQATAPEDAGDAPAGVPEAGALKV